ncbi:MAG: hypothetical protein QXJ40_05815 [Candidatus Bathyarchaeia archaeon]|nr:hypothetical protein [Candidatus Bathyarchaeota archaeon]
MSGKSGSVWIWVSAGFLCLVIVAAYISVYYYMEAQKYRQLYDETLRELSKFSGYILVNIMIDYGNGSTVWHNNTAIARGASLFEATKTIAEVAYEKYPFGVFITAINNVAGNQTHAWLWYIWNSTKKGWDFGPTGAESFILREGDVASWVYTKWA